MKSKMKSKNKKKVFLVEQTDEFYIRAIFTTEELIEESLSDLLNLSDEAVIDTNFCYGKYDDDQLVYVVSEDGVDWHHSFFIYNEEDGKKEKLSLIRSNKYVSYFNYP